MGPVDRRPHRRPSSARPALLRLLTRRPADEAPLPRASAGGRPVLVWDEGGDDCELVDPDPALAHDLLDRLDGRTRTTVSVLRGAGRLDVGGDASGPVVVLASQDRRTWHQVCTPHADDGEAPVTIGRTTGRYPRSEVTTIEVAHAALTAWLRDGARDPALGWRTSDRRWQAVRPPSLEADDAR